MIIRYSIIIPHFRIPKLLERALWSVPCREDVEVIVVDDASGEEYTPQIEAVCAERNRLSLQMCGGEQVRLILMPQNGGGGKARNEGLKVAQGRWVVFLDADDMFNYCIREAMDDYANDDADIVFFRASSIDNDTFLPLSRASRINECVNEALKETAKGDKALRYAQGCPVSKFVKRELLTKHGIWFEEIRKHNDVRFAYTSGYYADEIKADPRAIYCITSRADSVSMDVSAEARLLRVNVMVDMIKFKIDHNVTVDEDNWIMLFDTMAEIHKKNKKVYEEGVVKINSAKFDKTIVNKGLNKALRNARMRKIIPTNVRLLIHKLMG